MSGVVTARLDGRQRSKRAILAKLARDLDFPSHFGGNLDALFDVLTTDIAGPLAIEWHLTRRAAMALGGDLGPVRRTLEDAAAERADLRLTVIEED
jgi:ribonuclease inhibitor